MQGFTEEEVTAAANQAAKDAAASSELSIQAVDQGDAQSRYYSLAHSVEEVVKAQPAMLQVPPAVETTLYSFCFIQRQFPLRCDLHVLLRS